MTILEFIEKTGEYFTRNGVESPRLTAELMLAEGLQKKRLQLYLEFDKEIAPAVLDALRPLVKRRAQGEPLQYVQGFAEFAGARFTVTPDVLIPRPETEMLLAAATAQIKPEGAAIADIGTGSGALAVSLARKFPTLPVHAIDISPAALIVAQKNGANLPNLHFHEGNLLSPLPAETPLQAIMANLPYIPTTSMEKLSREVLQEPRSALDGGVDGLDLIRRLIAEATGRAPWIGLEICEGQAPEVESLLQSAGWTETEAIKDLRGVPRILIGKA
jgi:release factor glutamine methyltransferase